MRASITFLVLWLGSLLMGFVVCFVMHADMLFSEIVRVWFEHDIVYALIVGWILSGLVILYLYTESTSKKNTEEETVNK